MNRKGISYDIGRVMGGNWRPIFDQRVVRREIDIIKDDLHCNAIRICGLSIDRLVTAAEIALEAGLEVWLSPEMWERGQEATLAYIQKAADAAESLRQRWPGKVVFIVGSEFTLFTKGITEGRNVAERMRRLMIALGPAKGQDGNSSEMLSAVKRGAHAEALGAFLATVAINVRRIFRGEISYASIIWESVDWNLFDFVGVDHYWNAKIADRYVELLRPLFAMDKPVVITEFGFRTYQGAATSTEGMAGDIINYKPSLALIAKYLLGRAGSLVGMQLPPPRMRLKEGDWRRDESGQARSLADQLETLDRAGVDGAFIMTFISPIASHSEDPRHDYDLNSYSVVKSYEDGRRGTTYPDMPWEPKEAFFTIADYYSRH